MKAFKDWWTGNRFKYRDINGEEDSEMSAEDAYDYVLDAKNKEIALLENQIKQLKEFLLHIYDTGYSMREHHNVKTILGIKEEE